MKTALDINDELLVKAKTLSGREKDEESDRLLSKRVNRRAAFRGVDAALQAPGSDQCARILVACKRCQSPANEH